MDMLSHSSKSCGVHDHIMDDVEAISSTLSKPQSQQRGNDEKKAAVQQEMVRMNQLPCNSTYAIHRLRVLNKILQLLSIQRTVSQDEELELLFSGMHL